MPNPRRNSYSNSQATEHAFHVQGQSFSSTLVYSLPNLLKKPHAFPFLLSALLLLTWASFRLQRTSLQAQTIQPVSSPEDDLKANLVRFTSLLSSPIVKDNRGWFLDPISLALNSGVKGGALTCASVHVGEIRPRGVRGNHRHHSCNETFVIWGAITKYRIEIGNRSGAALYARYPRPAEGQLYPRYYNRKVENGEMAEGFAEVIIGKDEVAVAASTKGTAHALVNVDPSRTTFFLGCQDGVINHNASNSDTDYKIWQDLLNHTS